MSMTHVHMWHKLYYFILSASQVRSAKFVAMAMTSPATGRNASTMAMTLQMESCGGRKCV